MLKGKRSSGIVLQQALYTLQQEGKIIHKKDLIDLDFPPQRIRIINE